MTRVVEPDRPSLSTAMTRRCGSETANPNAPEDLAEKRIVGRLVIPPRVPALAGRRRYDIVFMSRMASNPLHRRHLYAFASGEHYGAPRRCSAAGARARPSSEAWALNGLDAMMKCFCPLWVRSYDWVGRSPRPKGAHAHRSFFSQLRKTS
jgi:hypothetical protein